MVHMMARSRTWRNACIASVACLLGLVTCRVDAQTVFQGNLSEQQKGELATWSALYWQRKDQGGGSPGAEFAFSTAAMNSQLFNPLRATRATLEKVGVIGPADCDGLGENSTNVASEAVTKAFRDSMISAKIETSVANNYVGTLEHANLIFAAPASAGLTAYVDGDKLVSENLPLEKVSAEAFQAALKFNLSPQSQSVVSLLIGSGAQWSQDSGVVNEAKKLVTGQPSKADNFELRVRQALIALENTGLIDAGTTSIQRINAIFGVAGELPMVAVCLRDSYVLLDPTTGNLSGPFERGSALDGRGLLSQHPEAYQAGDSVRYLDAQGCGTPAIAAWIPWGIYPGTLTPRPAVPALPPGTIIPPFPVGPPGTITTNPTLPGWDTAPACTGPAVPAVPYSCTVYRMYIDATGKLVWVREVYGCPAAATAPPAGCFTASPTRDVWW
ncbi:MAG: hypothetical protein K2W85_09540 [Phycisphaerales bacterium]|nr:hypothetical protein [Phycisphaerales bacterium]